MKKKTKYISPKVDDLMVKGAPPQDTPAATDLDAPSTTTPLTESTGGCSGGRSDVGGGTGTTENPQ